MNDLEKQLEQLIAAGEAPNWLKIPGFQTLCGGYLLKDETPKDMYRRVAKGAASYYSNSNFWEQKFFEHMWKGWLCPSTPILSNLSSDRGMPLSCFSLHVHDSINDIYLKNWELSILSKNGGGVGIYLGDIRGSGAPIKGGKNGVSDGIIPWSRTYDVTASAVSQGSTRRGQAAVYLPIEHVDIEEFMNMRRPTGDLNRRCMNLNHGVTIKNQWMKEMLAGDLKKRRLWEILLKNRVETGEPYIMFVDNANDQNPECYKANGLSVKTSNICCLAGDTLVLTSEGPQRIDSLVGKTVTIFDGKNWVENDTFEQRGEDELIRIHFKNGTYVDSNANHRWFVSKSWIGPQTYELCHTKDLKIGYVVESNHLLEENGREGVIVKIEKLSGIHPVYCPNLPTTGKFALANGLMTGNTEIFLHTDETHTFVCCLSSLNFAKYHEWKDTDLVETAVRFLDAVMEEYIRKSEGIPGLENSRRSAIKGRAIGIGALGWHTLLQENMIPFDSFEAMRLNNEIWKLIRERAEEETKKLAEELGEPEWCKGFNRRNTHLLACAPTVSNSTIAGGHSAGIEPIAANIFVQKSAKGTFIRKNCTLEKLLESKGKNTPEVWKSINEQQGSVQHLGFLSKEEKEVFLTAREINQHAIIKQAAQRQKYIDQGQSVNLFFTTNASPKYIHEVHLAAWEMGLKSLYYFRSEGSIRGDSAFRSKDECSACEG